METADILLIEDNSTDTELILRTFKKQKPDLKVKIATDGAAAIGVLSELSDSMAKKTAHAPKVIILDLNMPKMNGQQVLRKVKEDKFTSTIPVVILTSSANETDIRECYRLQANSYIVKPVDYEEFSRTISGIVHYWIDLNQTPEL
jgi:two-component system response regulator